jgi:hypothetical protein
MGWNTCLLILLVILVFYVNLDNHVSSRPSFPTDTIQRVLYSILKRMDSVTSMTSPDLALIQIRECQSSLQTLIQLVGGESSLDILCGINVERIQNILYFQETQLQEISSDQSVESTFQHGYYNHL